MYVCIHISLCKYEHGSPCSRNLESYLKEIFIREIYYRLIIIYSYIFVQEYSLSFEFCYSFL